MTLVHCRRWLVGLAGVLVATSLSAQETLDHRRQFETTAAKGISFLTTKGRASDGSYSAFASPAVTGIVVTALLRHGVSPDEPRIAESLRYLTSFAREDGGIYQLESSHKNYETAIAVLCLSEANRDGRYTALIGRADKFLKGIQWDAAEGADSSHTAFGGAGYGSHNRPDLSNTSFLIDALKAAGNEADSEAIQRALVFISRCQNLESEYNTTEFPVKNPDGGFYYTPAAGGASQADQTENGGLRSYGSMTYAGLKSMIYAGVGPDDKRVKAAVAWIEKNYTLAANPGMPPGKEHAGLYYYFHTFAKALDAMGFAAVKDAQGATHDWRRELTAELARRQQPDGSWINENVRWMEGDANLVTAYALLALSYCKPAN